MLGLQKPYMRALLIRHIQPVHVKDPGTHCLYAFLSSQVVFQETLKLIEQTSSIQSCRNVGKNWGIMGLTMILFK